MNTCLGCTTELVLIQIQYSPTSHTCHLIRLGIWLHFEIWVSLSGFDQKFILIFFNSYTIHCLIFLTLNYSQFSLMSTVLFWSVVMYLHKPRLSQKQLLQQFCSPHMKSERQREEGGKWVETYSEQRYQISLFCFLAVSYIYTVNCNHFHSLFFSPMFLHLLFVRFFFMNPFPLIWLLFVVFVFFGGGFSVDTGQLKYNHSIVCHIAL